MDATIASILRVICHEQREDYPCVVLVDEYVPLRFRTYDMPLGSGCVRLGNYRSQLLETWITPHSGLVRGVTLTSFEGLSEWPSFSAREVRLGLPTLAARVPGGERLDLNLGFRVAVKGRVVGMFWEEMSECDVFSFGSVEFLVARGFWAAATFELNDTDMVSFLGHVES